VLNAFVMKNLPYISLNKLNPKDKNNTYQISTKIKLYLLPKEKKNKFSNLIEKSQIIIVLFGLIF